MKTPVTGQPANNNVMEVIFENCAPFTECICEINNTIIEYDKDIYLVMSMYNLIGSSDNCKTSGSV